MRILLDECILRKLKYSLPDQACQTVPEAGLAGKNTSRISRAGASRFLILRAKSNRFADLLPLVPSLLRIMDLARKGEIHRIKGGDPPS